MTAYDVRISVWSSDVCSSDLALLGLALLQVLAQRPREALLRIGRGIHRLGRRRFGGGRLGGGRLGIAGHDRATLPPVWGAVKATRWRNSAADAAFAGRRRRCRQDARKSAAARGLALPSPARGGMFRPRQGVRPAA